MAKMIHELTVAAVADQLTGYYDDLDAARDERDAAAAERTRELIDDLWDEAAWWGVTETDVHQYRRRREADSVTIDDIPYAEAWT